MKRRDTGALATPAAPANVLERTVVDVSFLAGMLVDKFRYHLPLYRQHRRLTDSGIRVSRGSLTNWAGRAIDLLEPVVAAQAAHILQGAVIAMDETSVKAGRVAPGKMRTGYFWPVYGEVHELVFHYAPSRAHKHVEAFLGDFRGTLLSDGYAAYEAYARRHRIAHAQCRAHCRRNFTDAKESEPAGVAEALSLIGGLYAHEKAIRKKKLTGPSKLAHRREHATPAVEAFFDWCQALKHIVYATRRWPMSAEATMPNPLTSGKVRQGDSKTGLRTIWLGPDAVQLIDRLPPDANAVRVFPHDLTSDYVCRFWCTVREHARLRGVRIDDCRHAWDSQGLIHGVGLPTVGRLLGHRNRRTTAIYAHLDDAALRDAAAQTALVIAEAMGFSAQSLVDDAPDKKPVHMHTIRISTMSPKSMPAIPRFAQQTIRPALGQLPRPPRGNPYRTVRKAL